MPTLPMSGVAQAQKHVQQCCARAEQGCRACKQLIGHTTGLCACCGCIQCVAGAVWGGEWGSGWQHMLTTVDEGLVAGIR
jgi:hypothetical protein